MAKQAAVLIVEDEQMTRAVLRDVLEPEGYRLFEASNGKDGLALLESEHPSVVLLDLLMPVMSGLEVLRRMGERSSHVPVVVISSMDTDSLVGSAIEAGVRGFIAKPFHRLEVLEAVRAALHE
ncbi:MAG: response regulator transcription factor [Myxococcaceae bacterium]